MWCLVFHLWQCLSQRSAGKTKKISHSKFSLKIGFLSLFTQTDTILNTGLLSVGGLLPKPARRIKRYPAHFIVEGEFIRRLIQDYRPFVARSSPQKVDIKIIKTCPNPRTHGGLLPPQLRLSKIP